MTVHDELAAVLRPRMAVPGAVTSAEAKAQLQMGTITAVTGLTYSVAIGGATTAATNVYALDGDASFAVGSRVCLLPVGTSDGPVWVILGGIGGTGPRGKEYTFQAPVTVVSINLAEGGHNARVYWQAAGKTSSQVMRMIVNGDGGNNYRYSMSYFTNGASISSDNGNTPTTAARVGFCVQAGNPGSSGCIELIGYQSAVFGKMFPVREAVADVNTSTGMGTVIYSVPAPITYVSFFLDSGNQFHEASRFWTEYF